MKDRVAPKPPRFTINEDISDEDEAFIVDNGAIRDHWFIINGRHRLAYCVCDPCDAESICAALNAHAEREKDSGVGKNLVTAQAIENR